jgi:hypothetical protein
MRIGPIRQANFEEGTTAGNMWFYHAVGSGIFVRTAQFSRLDRQVHSRQVRPHRGDSHVDAGAHVAGAADDLQRFWCAGVGVCGCGVGRGNPHGADAQLVGVGMGRAGFHIPHHDAGRAGG